MTKKRSTKRALLMSALSLLMCVSMLIGSTFAWFTDSVTSGNNVIKSGNLDLDVQYTLDGKEWKALDGATDLFQKGLWEPGHTEVVVLKVENKGSLALKYVANMNIVSEIIGKNMDNEDITLSDILTVNTLTIEAAGVDPVMGWDIAAMTLEKAFEDENAIGWGESTSFKDGNILEQDMPLYAGSTQYVFVKVDMAETVGNQANHNGTDVPSIEFGINIFATQFTYESDSFGTDYDKDAKYPVITNADELKEATTNITENATLHIVNDISMTDGSAIHTNDSTGAIVINGNGKTIESSASSIDAFQWENGMIPAMSTILSSADGSTVTVNNTNFGGTMSALMLGHYQNATYNNYNTVLNNVNVVDAKVVSFSSNVSPAVCVYGTAVLNNCNIYGTTLSELDTDPMWPVYDVAAVNYSDLTVNGGKIGSIYMWNQAKVTIADDADVDTIVVRGNMNTTKYGLTIKAGATVDSIDLSALTNKARINITIEDGATVGKIVANGVEYATIADWQNA